jgi:hypothetical protein
MKGIHHPFGGALYERDGEGNLLVTDGDRWGRFRADGSWIEGELRECDPQLGGWVLGPQAANHRIAKAVVDEPVDK